MLPLGHVHIAWRGHSMLFSTHLINAYEPKSIYLWYLWDSTIHGLHVKHSRSSMRSSGTPQEHPSLSRVCTWVVILKRVLSGRTFRTPLKAWRSMMAVHFSWPKLVASIYDANACFYCLNEIPGNIGQICSKVFDIMGMSGDVVFSTDQYLPHSFCGVTAAWLWWENLSWKKNQPDWKTLLLLTLCSSDEYASKVHRRRAILICEGGAHLLTSSDGKTTTNVECPTLKSSQEETDSRVILYLHYARCTDYKSFCGWKA